jgi:hypothetical protein
MCVFSLLESGFFQSPSFRVRLHARIKTLGIVAQGMFQLREINQMEREMCQYLLTQLTFFPHHLRQPLLLP